MPGVSRPPQAFVPPTASDTTKIVAESLLRKQRQAGRIEVQEAVVERERDGVPVVRRGRQIRERYHAHATGAEEPDVRTEGLFRQGNRRA
jgi:hypothetical protein